MNDTTVESTEVVETDAPETDVEIDETEVPEGQENEGLETPAPKAKEPALPDKITLKVKVMGEEKLVTATTKEITDLVQKGLAADDKFKSAARKEQQLEKAAQIAQEDPFVALQRLGVSAEKIEEAAIALIANRLKEEEMSPEQKTQRERDQKLSKYEQEEQKRQQEKSRSEAQEKDHQEATRMGNLFGEALQKAGLPKDSVTFRRMLHFARAAVKQGEMDSLTADKLAGLVKKSLDSDLRTHYGTLEGKSLLDSLGTDFVRRIQKALSAQLATPEDPVPNRDKQPRADRPTKKRREDQKQLTGQQKVHRQIRRTIAEDMRNN